MARDPVKPRGAQFLQRKARVCVFLLLFAGSLQRIPRAQQRWLRGLAGTTLSGFTGQDFLCGQLQGEREGDCLARALFFGDIHPEGTGCSKPALHW